MHLFKSRKREKIPMRRTSSEQLVAVNVKENNRPQMTVHEAPPQYSHRSRANTFSNGVSHSAPPPSSLLSQSASSLPFTDNDKLMENLNSISPMSRYFERRVGICEKTINLPIPTSIQADSNSILIRLRTGGQRIQNLVPVSDALTLRDLVEMSAFKHEIELDDLDSFTVSALLADGNTKNLSLNQPSRDYSGLTVDIREKTPFVKSQSEYTLAPPTRIFKTVKDCLDYFDSHGLIEMPLPPRKDENYHLPRVQPVDSIVTSWSDLPIDPALRKGLSKREMEQQLAIWEFIATEHSFIRHLETIINIFMRCLELIQRTELLSEENYHNVFGYMEDIYNAHDQFWTRTLEPALEAVYESGTPLNLDEFISRFPMEFGTHFEIYEQHCQLEALNLHSLKRARENPQFVTYLEWCESQPECRRLGLDQLLAMPMQRLVRYPLLVTAILKKTSQPHIRQRLEHLGEEMQELVSRVNTSIRIQEETERVRDAMNRITGVQLVDIPSEIKELVQPHTHLDLLAPMTGVEVDQGRVLILEGTLKYRDGLTSKTVPLHLFLFTDMLLITKLSSRSKNKYTIIREPYKIDRLLLQPLEPGSFGAVVLNEFQVASSWFILKANSPAVATEWLVHINKAQRFYSEALERRTQHWQLIQSLQSERILDGIGQEGREALSASLWSLSPSLMDLNKRSTTGSIDNLSTKCNPGIRPLRRNPLSRTKSEDQYQKFLPQSNGMGLVRISSAACVGDKLRAAGSLDLLLEHPPTHTNLRCCQSQSQLTTSIPYKSDSDGVLSASFNQIPSSPLSQDSGTESGGTISADTLELSDEELVNLGSEGKIEKRPQKSLSADHTTVARESEKLKPILRKRDEAQFDTLKSILRSEQLDIPGKPLNRVKSDDSGIAIKQSPSSDFQNSCSPSPYGRISVPDSLSPRPAKPKYVHFRSQSDTSTINLDILSPTSEETGSITSSDRNDEIKVSAAISPPCTEPSSATATSINKVSCTEPSSATATSINKVSNVDKASSIDKASDVDQTQSLPPSKDPHTSTDSSTKSTEVKTTKLTSPKQSRLPPLTVSKKPLCRLKTPVNTPPGSPVKATASVPPKKANGPPGQTKTLPNRKKSTTVQAQSVSGPSKRKPSQLRRPSVVATKDCKNVSVKETKQKFESPTTSAVKPPKKDEKYPSLSVSKSASTVRKTPAQATPTHQRSKSSISPNDISNFRRQNAVRTRASSPKVKKGSIPKQSSLARSSTVNEPKRKISIAKVGKPASFDETRTDPLANPGKDKAKDDVLSKLEALTPPRASKLPRRVSKAEPSDPKIRIEVVGGSERGIDIPLNFNSNNSNKSLKSEIRNERERKPSTYHILDAVTVDNTVQYGLKCSTLPNKRKRNPIEWSHFGTSWKSPHTLHTYPTPRTVPQASS